MIVHAPLQSNNSVTPGPQLTGDKVNKMKNKSINFLVSGALLFMAIISSCQKNQIIPAEDLTGNSPMSRQQSHAGPAAVYLGTSSQFAILSKSGITNVYPSSVTGNVGTSPISGAAIHVVCSEVVGSIYSVNAAGPLPCRITNPTLLTAAVGFMQTAYNDAAGRTNPNFLNLGAGNIGGTTLIPGLYKWTTGVIIPSNVTLSGGPNAVWIFQVSGTLIMSSGVHIFLSGGAQAKNIYWQTTGAVTLGTTSHFEGTILGHTGINLQTGASINGRLLAQTAVTLQMNTVVKP